VKDAWLTIRSVFFWTLSVVHFFPLGILALVLSVFLDPRKHDGLLRVFVRNIVRCTGARLEVRIPPGFDAERTCFFVSNHVNIFDPMLLYSAIPQFARGLELESHFKVPVYGWIMQRFGNIPVPVVRSSAAMRALRERCRSALEDGISVVVFPEGHRTTDGSVGVFRPGVFRMARDFGVPIVPISMTGAFELKRKTSWMLRPATVVVQIHEPVDPADPELADEGALLERVHTIVAEPVESVRRASGPGSP
jgi:1-acyl-sn-glycerol-3-phosphate acyltransferase